MRRSIMKRSALLALGLLFVLIFTAWASVPSTALAARLARPVLLSPASDTHFDHYPRTTTLAWNRVADATTYQVDIQFYDQATSVWNPYPPVTISDAAATSFSFDFVGGQPGQWRVTTLDDTDTYEDSPPSRWRVFYYAH
jgi:hypothetical protein